MSQKAKPQAEKAFACEFENCNKRYDTARGLKSHISRSHQKKESETCENEDNWNIYTHSEYRNLIFRNSNTSIDEVSKYLDIPIRSVRKHDKFFLNRVESKLKEHSFKNQLRMDYRNECIHDYPRSIDEFETKPINMNFYSKYDIIYEKERNKKLSWSPQLETRKIIAHSTNWTKLGKAINLEKYKAIKYNELGWNEFEKAVREFTTSVKDALTSKQRKRTKNKQCSLNEKIKCLISEIRELKHQVKSTRKLANICDKHVRVNKKLNDKTKLKLKEYIHSSTNCLNLEEKLAVWRTINQTARRIQKVKKNLSRKLWRLKQRLRRKIHDNLWVQSRNKYYQKFGFGAKNVKSNVKLSDLEEYHEEITKSEFKKEMKEPTPWISEALNLNNNFEDFDWRITYDKVKNAVLNQKNNKSPGPDGIPSEVWKNLPETWEVLTLIFENCRVQQKIPDEWKMGVAYTIPKKDVVEQPKDLRLVIVQNTIYKIFSSVISNDIMDFSHKNRILDNNQRAYQKNIPGTDLNCFLLKETYEDIKRNRKGLSINTFFDISNAFGSIEHKQLMAILINIGFPETLCDLICNIIINQCFFIKTKNETSKVIFQNKGLKQGDSLSAILFVFAFEPLSRICKLEDINYRMQNDFLLKIHNLHFSDDIVAVTDSLEATKRFIYFFETFLEWTGMKPAPHKSVSSGFWHNKGLSTFNPRISLQNSTIRSLNEDNVKVEKYLGLFFDNTMNDCENNKHLETELMNRLTNVASFKTDFRTIITAIKEFVIPAIEYYFKNVTINETLLINMDRSILKCLKKHLRLDISTTTSFIRCKSNHGLNIPSLVDRYYRSKINFMLMLLNNEDEDIKTIAWYSLENSSKTKGKAPESLLNDENQINYIGLWKEVALALKYFNLKCRASEKQKMQVIDSKGEEIKNLKKYINDYLENKYLNMWKDLDSQDYFLKRGDDIIPLILHCSFSTWNTLVKGITSQLPVKALLKIRGKISDDQCDYCKKRHTQSHVLNNCSNLLKYYQYRHDNALKVIGKYIKDQLDEDEIMIFDTHCPGHLYSMPKGGVDHDRPDILVVNNRTKIIKLMEFTVCNDVKIEESMKRKEERYQQLRRGMKMKGFETKYMTLAIGSLGTIKKSMQNDLKLFLKKDILKCLHEVANKVILGTKVVIDNMVL